MVDRHDLLTLYGLVVKYYENHPVAGVGLLLVFNSLMLHLLRVKIVINSPWIMPILGTKDLASPEQTPPDAAFSRDILLTCADFSSILVKTQSSRYLVPTGRVVVPTGRYVVPAGNVIIVSSSRLSLIPTGRVLSPGGFSVFSCVGEHAHEGMDGCEQFMDVSEIIRDEDLMMHKTSNTGSGAPPPFYLQRTGRNFQLFVVDVVLGYKPRGPSARQRNLLKRKAKINLKDPTKGWSKDGEPDCANTKDLISPEGMSSDVPPSNS
nr:TATA-binding protein-associated factor BTAF1 isoform X1 [Tanacetum cinerariifolium]